MSEVKEYMWAFVRSDLDIKSFEQWLYSSSDLESLDAPLYLYLIEYDYKNCNSYDIFHLKDKLRAWLQNNFKSECSCVAWKNGEILYLGHNRILGFIGSEYFNEIFNDLYNRTLWLSIRRCKTCSTNWYIGLDTVDDFFILHRITDEEVSTSLNLNIWPTIYDTSPHFWPTSNWFKYTKFRNLEEWCKANNR